MPEAVHQLDLRAGDDPVVLCRRRVPSNVLLAEDHQQWLADRDQPVGQRSLGEIAADGDGDRAEDPEVEFAELVDIVLRNREAGMEAIPHRLPELVVGQFGPGCAAKVDFLGDVGMHVRPGVDQREGRHQVRPLFCQPGRENTAAGVTDDRGRAGAELVEDAAYAPGQDRYVVARAVRQCRTPAAGKVDADDSMSRNQQWKQRFPRSRRCRGAMKEKQGIGIGRAVLIGSEVDSVDRENAIVCRQRVKAGATGDGGLGGIQGVFSHAASVAEHAHPGLYECSAPTMAGMAGDGLLWDVSSPSRPIRLAGVQAAGFTDRGITPPQLRLIPHPAVTLILVFGGALAVDDPAGGRLRGSFVLAPGYGRVLRARQLESFSCLQIRLSPAVARAVIGDAVGALDGAVQLDDLWGRDAERLTYRLGDLRDWESRFALVERWLGERVSTGVATTPEVAWAWQQIAESHGSVRVDRLATELGWSRRQLWARFRSQVGLTPKSAAKLVRFDHAVHRLAVGQAPARVAAEAGFSDQSHLHRDVAAFTGLTPSTVGGEPFLAVDDVAWGWPGR